MVTNEDVARTLDEFAEIHGAFGDAHRRLAYERAAESVRGAGVTLSPGMDRDELQRLPNVGPRIAARIQEILRTGRLADIDELKRSDFPKDFHAFVDIRGVGPKLALRFKRDLDIDTLDDLARAAASGRLQELPGVGDLLAERILEAVPALQQRGPRRFLLARAEPLARALADGLRTVPGVVEVAIAGSIRRGRAAVKDVDLLASAADAPPVHEAFTRLPGVRDVISRGDRTHVRLQSGLEADLYVVHPDAWGAALGYFTGSREHTLELRERANARGCSLKNDGLVDGHGQRLPTRTEGELYGHLGLAFIPPEMRENRGEIEAAERGRLPDLVTPCDLKGDLHMHTTATDGTATLEEMVQAAHEMGRTYVAITDHARGLTVPRGLDEETLLSRKEEVAARDFPLPVLVGAEVNIMDDGSLSLDDPTLETLDLVIASVHSGLREPRAKITKRVTDAIGTGLVDVLGHPTNRRLPKRPESDIDFERVFDAAAHHGTAMEIDASPERMDLPGHLVKRAKEHALKFTIDSDAHHPRELANLHLGATCARRGWLEKDDVLTARDYDGFRAWLDGRR